MKPLSLPRTSSEKLNKINEVIPHIPWVEPHQTACRIGRGADNLKLEGWARPAACRDAGSCAGRRMLERLQTDSYAASSVDAPTVMPGRLKFSCFEADLRSGELTKQGKRLRLQEQPFRLLAMLLERPRELVTREEVRRG